MEEDKDAPINMGRPFPSTERTLIDVAILELIMRVNNDQVVLNIFKAMKYLETTYCYFVVNIIEQTNTKV